MPASTPSATPFGNIAGYELKGKLGSGGMGVVYKALDLKLHRTVALKFVSDELSGSEHRDRLLREARAASALDHPNIAAIHTIEELPDGRAFIVMGYYQGETLGDKARFGPLQPSRAVNVTQQIARGLQHAHERGVIHRDIKPSNVMITDEGTAKILDFGLASSYGAVASTDTAGLRGTLPYMAPEQLQNRAPDARTDIWALGVVFYQVLTGRLPFSSESAGATLMAILTTPPPAMNGVADDLQVIVFRMLAKDPAARYQTCAELLRDLEQLAPDDSAPTVTVPRSEIQRQLRSAVQSASGVVARPSHRARWIAIAIGVMAVLAIAAAVYRSRKVFAPEQKHIAVLPFAAPASDAATQSLADGLMESIAGRLANLNAGGESLWVVPATQIRRRKIEDSETAHKELGVTLVVTGAVSRAGGDIRLRVDLIDVQSQRLLGSFEVSGAENSLPGVEDDVVARLASLMNVSGASREKAPVVAGVAYEYYLKGRGLLQRYDIAENVDQAIAQFEAATKSDPSFALAYNALAEANWDKYRLDQNPAWLDKANEYGSKALQLNTELPAVYITLGNIHNATGNYEIALEEFQHALKLDPVNADALLGLSRVYESLGRDKEAEQTVQRGAALRPDYWGGPYELGTFYFRHRRFAEAAREYQRVIQLVPDSAAAHANYATALKNLGQTQAAEVEFKKSLDLKPTYAAYNNLGSLDYDLHRWADSAAMFQAALKLNPGDYRVYENVGLALDWLGRHDEALQNYRQARELLRKTLKLKPDDAQLQARLALLYARDHQREQSLPLMDAALARAPDDPIVLSDAAETHELLGSRQIAVVELEKALAKGWRRQSAENSIVLRNVVADPSFRQP
jgi:tetratricopeptide (TPR) repeat protein/TolB-like protein